MASPNKLYPVLPSDVPATLAVSSDEDDDSRFQYVRSSHRITESRTSSSRKGEHVVYKSRSDHDDRKSVLSLTDFENSFFKEEKPKKLARPTNPSKSNKPTLLFYELCIRYFKSTLNTLYKWKVVLIGAFCGLLVIMCLDEGTGRDNYLTCPAAIPLDPCIESDGADMAMSFARRIRNYLHFRAGEHDCGRTDLPRGLTFGELKDVSAKEWGVELVPEDIRNTLNLILSNNHWGIRVYDLDEALITDLSQGGDIDQYSLESTRPYRTFPCRLRHWMAVAWEKIRMIMLVVSLVVAVVLFVRYYIHRRKIEEAAMYIMVEKIIEILKAHYRKSQKNKDILPYLAIIHVRDALILPSERHKKQVIWDKAVKWIASKESRVRVENRIIAGEEFPVWRWIQSEPPRTEEPDSAWPGKAFEDYPSGLESKMAPPVGTPSICVRIKNMFEQVKKMEGALAKEIRDSVIRRCQPCGNIVHVYIDKRSAHGCVYFKMDSLKSAIHAYKTLHGSWYKGRLITTKYIPEPKYYKWFPHAAAANTPLTLD